MITHSARRVLYGAVVNPISLQELQFYPHALIAISDSGRIEWMVEDADDAAIQELMAQHGWMIDDVDFLELQPGTWVMPGFVDTHTHAPQYPNLGSGQEYELLDWLAKVTFPTEARFSDLDYSSTTYPLVVQRTLNSGTTTCCYFGTLHLEATKVLADTIHLKGQRAFVGKCNMDRNASESYQESSHELSLAETGILIHHIRSLSPTESRLVHPILTPRFAISCTPALLTGLGRLAEGDPSLAIQTHISENKSEVAFTKTLFPEAPSYAGVYDTFGLLNERTILAHGCYLEEEELDLIKRRGAGLSHCPTSNFNLRSGMANVGRWLDKEIKVGLGTDMSGGFSPSILAAIQHASICSKVVSLQTSTPPTLPQLFEGHQFSIPTLVYLATLGGAAVCGLSDSVGSFAVGKDFDALIIDIRPKAGNPVICLDEQSTPLNAQLERFLFCGDDRNIATVFVKNRIVGGADSA